MSNMNTQNILVEVMIRWYKEIFYEIGMSKLHLGMTLANLTILARDMELLSNRCNGNNLPLESNNNFLVESSDGLDEDDR
jgi:hypothetical protein